MKLFAESGAAGLESLIIGGHAVILHGVPRSTFDRDLVVRRRDRETWQHFLLERGYTIFHETDVFQQWQAPAGMVALDLMMMDEATWGKLDASAQEFTIGGSRCRVVSPPHLIALKLHAMKFRPHGEGERDWQDILGLIRANALDPVSKPLLELVQRYADAATASRYARHFPTS